MSQLKQFLKSLKAHYIIHFLVLFAVCLTIIILKFGMIPEGLVALGFMTAFCIPLAIVSWRSRKEYPD